jgi:hypothetical protein
VKPAASEAKNEEYDISTNRAVSKLDSSLMRENLVNRDVKQPMALPIAKAPRNMPKKLPTEEKKFPMLKLFSDSPNFSICLCLFYKE